MGKKLLKNGCVIYCDWRILFRIHSRLLKIYSETFEVTKESEVESGNDTIEF